MSQYIFVFSMSLILKSMLLLSNNNLCGNFVKRVCLIHEFYLCMSQWYFFFCVLASYTSYVSSKIEAFMINAICGVNLFAAFPLISLKRFYFKVCGGGSTTRYCCLLDFPHEYGWEDEHASQWNYQVILYDKFLFTLVLYRIDPHLSRLVTFFLLSYPT